MSSLTHVNNNYYISSNIPANYLLAISGFFWQIISGKNPTTYG